MGKTKDILSLPDTAGPQRFYVAEVPLPLYKRIERQRIKMDLTKRAMTKHILETFLEAGK